MIAAILSSTSTSSSGLNLVIAAIVYRNSAYIADAAAHLRGIDEPLPDDLLAHISPVGWRHIAFSGDFLWDRDPGLVEEGDCSTCYASSSRLSSGSVLIMFVASVVLRHNQCDDLQPSPLRWDHINLAGDYVWSDSVPLDAEGFMPHRQAVQ